MSPEKIVGTIPKDPNNREWVVGEEPEDPGRRKVLQYLGLGLTGIVTGAGIVGLWERWVAGVQAAEPLPTPPAPMPKIGTASAVQIGIRSAQAEVPVVNSEENGKSSLFDKERGVFLPQVGPVYQQGPMELRETTMTKEGKLNPWGVHGNKNYYAEGKPSWFGQDFITTSPDKRVISPIDGYSEGGWDPNALYYCSIKGTGEYEGLYIRIIHLASPCSGGQIRRGSIIGEENSDKKHVHVITLWGSGVFRVGEKDVPISLLFAPEEELGSYPPAGHIEDCSVSPKYFSWFEI